jgi:hypothetical protein
MAKAERALVVAEGLWGLLSAEHDASVRVAREGRQNLLAFRDASIRASNIFNLYKEAMAIVCLCGREEERRQA